MSESYVPSEDSAPTTHAEAVEQARQEALRAASHEPRRTARDLATAAMYERG